MNVQERDIMKIMMDTAFTNQRTLAERSGHSLGVVNRSLRALIAEGYLDRAMHLTPKGEELRDRLRPKRAIILAAGFGMRMVPINLETPKALLEVSGEPLIERQIRQLHEAGIHEIYVVVGFMKEKFEYRIDEYGIKLVVNRDYASKNNLHSMALVTDHLSDAYIVPCDIWCAQNPFSAHELYSWYMVSDREDPESDVRVNRRRELVAVDRASGDRSADRKAYGKGSGTRSGPSKTIGNAMVGIAYLQEDIAQIVRERIRELCASREYDGAFWEEALYEKGREKGRRSGHHGAANHTAAGDTTSGRYMIVPARVVSGTDVVEINTYEQLRELDSGSNQLRSEVLDVIAHVFSCTVEEITDIEVLKKGMTNRSFLFSCRGGKYIMRVPGEGTDKLIDRRQEAEVYRAISGKGLCDDSIYLDPETGYKITKYLEGVRVCDAGSAEDLKRCMAKLRNFHEMGLKVGHSFDIFGQIDFYESLWEGRPSVYRDYKAVKDRVLSLRPFIEENAGKRVLTHIDAVPDNFLFYRDGSRDGNEGGDCSTVPEGNNAELLQLTDWEYAGMQDPHVDIAMFCIYSYYDKAQADHLIDLYFDGQCPPGIRTKIYCYIAVCGLLWSNWSEYKRNLGIDYGEYAQRQYRYAEEFYEIARKEILK